MNTGQVQIRISLSPQLYDFVRAKASRLGLPVTQFVKHTLIEDVKKEEYPTFVASKKVIRNAKQALREYAQGKTIRVDNIHEFFEKMRVSK